MMDIVQIMIVKNLKHMLHMVFDLNKLYGHGMSQY